MFMVVMRDQTKLDLVHSIGNGRCRLEPRLFSAMCKSSHVFGAQREFKGAVLSLTNRVAMNGQPVRLSEALKAWRRLSEDPRSFYIDTRPANLRLLRLDSD
jgi:hypothetical protein